jgi:hypothetical protein
MRPATASRFVEAAFTLRIGAAIVQPRRAASSRIARFCIASDC